MDAAQRKVRELCKRRLPGRARDQVRLESNARGAAITVEERSGRYVAQFRYDEESGKWTLFWADRGGRWRPYEDTPSSEEIDTLIDEVDRDPSGVFWG